MKQTGGGEKLTPLVQLESQIRSIHPSSSFLSILHTDNTDTHPKIPCLLDNQLPILLLSLSLANHQQFPQTPNTNEARTLRIQRILSITTGEDRISITLYRSLTLQRTFKERGVRRS